MSSRTISGRKCQRQPSRADGPSWATSHLLPVEPGQHPAPGSWRRRRCRPRPGCDGPTARPSAPDPAPRRRSAAVRPRQRGQGGQAERELAAPSRPFAVGRDGPAVHLDQRLDQAEADPQPALRPVRAVLGLDEHLEDVGEHLGHDPDARVPDPHDGLAALSPGLQADQPPRLGVLDGVVQQVPEDLLQPRRVGLQQDRLVRERDGQRVPALLERRPDRLDRTLDDRGEAHDLLAELDLPLGDPGDVHAGRRPAGPGGPPAARPSPARPRARRHRRPGTSSGAGRSGSGPGGCAARGPASRGTRPSGDRPPAGRRRAGRSRWRSPPGGPGPRPAGGRRGPYRRPDSAATKEIAPRIPVRPDQRHAQVRPQAQPPQDAQVLLVLGRGRQHRVGDLGDDRRAPVRTTSATPVGPCGSGG